MLDQARSRWLIEWHSQISGRNSTMDELLGKAAVRTAVASHKRGLHDGVDVRRQRVMDNQVNWRLLVRRETGKQQAVRVTHDEALAIRIDPDAVVGRSEETAKVFAEAMQKCPDGAGARG